MCRSRLVVGQITVSGNWVAYFSYQGSKFRGSLQRFRNSDLYPYHGRSAYFFLKGIRREAEGDRVGQITAEKVFRDVMEDVAYLARRLFNRKQLRQLMGGELDRVLVAY